MFSRETIIPERDHLNIIDRKIILYVFNIRVSEETIISINNYRAFFHMIWKIPSIKTLYFFFHLSRQTINKRKTIIFCFHIFWRSNSKILCFRFFMFRRKPLRKCYTFFFQYGTIDKNCYSVLKTW